MPRPAGKRSGSATSPTAAGEISVDGFEKPKAARRGMNLKDYTEDADGEYTLDGRKVSARTPGAHVLGINAWSVNDLISRIEVGFPTSSLNGLSGALQITKNSVLDLAGISPRTFARRSEAGHLNAEESERVARLARVTERVHAVMGQENGNSWLNQTWPALKHQTPLSYARTDLGAEAVIDLIGALDEGIFV